jgi:putative cardiolipin synthase
MQRDTRLGRIVAPQAEAHPGECGIYSLLDAPAALAARVHLARTADRSLNAQYYIWRIDTAGTLLAAALREAADRGVRVRLLLDDNNTSRRLDTALAALDAHPNIEVRLFNPLFLRRARVLGYLIDFSRLNRRMHNKSFTVDETATIVGGRNVGDEYFGAADGMLFVDFDVLAVGPVVGEVARDFERYWNSESAYPLDRVLKSPPPLARAEGEPGSATSNYSAALNDSSFTRELMEGSLTFEWAKALLVTDDPAKALGRAPRTALLTRRLKAALGEPAADLDIVSAYFVPTAALVAWMKRLASSGVKIRVLTNSLEATDVAIVHAGYSKRRKALLQSGIALYELQCLPSAERVRHKGRRKPSSTSSLHAKVFAVDGRRVFVGSFNFDPRSAYLNTEMGFVIESPELARHVAAAFDDFVPANAFELRLSGSGRLYWLERDGIRSIRHDTEPGVGLWLRMKVWLISLLPIEWLL